MRTTIDSYKSRAGRLDLEGIDFDDFRDQPLPADALRSLRYMHDVEHHTVCYLRDLLLTPAHQDPAITSFLSCWAFEEMWHGEAIGQVLQAHGEEAGAPRIAALPYLRSGQLREVLPQWKSMPMNVSVAFIKSRQAAPRVSAFVDWLAELFERSQEMDDTLTRLFHTARRPVSASVSANVSARAAASRPAAARDEDAHEETTSES